MATLNRLQGQDDPRLCAELIRELSNLASLEELAHFLPENQVELESSLTLLELNLDELLADFRPPEGEETTLRSMSFAVSAEDESAIEAAVSRAMVGLEGKNRRGRAIANIARSYLAGDGQ